MAADARRLKEVQQEACGLRRLKEAWHACGMQRLKEAQHACWDAAAEGSAADVWAAAAGTDLRVRKDTGGYKNSEKENK